ncbi:MAG: ABC transporter ATP-binding protein, partial [Clostridium sp.]
KNYVAVNNLDLSIESGCIVGLIGPNGAGKTTIINMLMGIIEPTEGCITINNLNIINSPYEVKMLLGYVSDDENKFLSLKALEYLNFVSDMYELSSEVRKERIETLSKRFSIFNELNMRMDKFSKGMKQKIMIIASLMHSPRVWVLDEPFDGLDPEISYDLKVFMKEYSSLGNTIILSSHILEIVENLCDKIILIKKGNTLYYGDLSKLKNRYGNKKSLEEIYIDMFSDAKSRQ